MPKQDGVLNPTSDGSHLLLPPMCGGKNWLVEGFDPATSFGLEVSARYDDHLRGDEVDVTVGDMASPSAPRDKYPLVYLVFNITRTVINNMSRSSA